MYSGLFQSCKRTQKGILKLYNFQSEAVKARNDCANMALNDLIKFLNEGGDVLTTFLFESLIDFQVAIYDGTNTSVERRNMVKELLNEKLPSHSVIQLYHPYLWRKVNVD